MKAFFEILEGAFVADLKLLFNSGSFTTMKRQCWASPPLGAHVAASRTSRMISSGTGSGFSRRIARIVRIASNRLIFRSIWTCSYLRCCGIGCGPR
jgi:hypothetical protein